LHEHLRNQSKLFGFNNGRSADIDKMFPKRLNRAQKSPTISEHLALEYLRHISHDLNDLSRFLDKSLATAKPTNQDEFNKTIDYITSAVRSRKR
jgi:hypothetical protein